MRELGQVVTRENAQIGVLITLQDATALMRKECAAGFYQSPGWHTKHRRLHVLAIAELMAGQTVNYPPALNVTFKKAPKAKTSPNEQLSVADDK